ncbi:DUF6779 domain-containing protein [Actinophytocola sp.]|uniref:DUF6779 domain-containing protein n=1 Tax=Actinophytocola sp. TaxID=1872138 RepID=UPI002EDAFA54
MAATGVLVLSDDLKWMRLGIVAGLWAALVGAFVAARYRRQVAEREEDAVERQERYELELEREIAARREYELEVAAEAKREAEEEARDDMAALRQELHNLRHTLQSLVGGEFMVERFALRAESTRMRSLPESHPLARENQLKRLPPARSTEDDVVIPPVVQEAQTDLIERVHEVHHAKRTVEPLPRRADRPSRTEFPLPEPVQQIKLEHEPHPAEMSDRWFVPGALDGQGRPAAQWANGTVEEIDSDWTPSWESSSSGAGSREQQPYAARQYVQKQNHDSRRVAADSSGYPDPRADAEQTAIRPTESPSRANSRASRAEASGYTDSRAAPSRAEASGYPNPRTETGTLADASGYTDPRAAAGGRADASGYPDPRAEAVGQATVGRADASGYPSPRAEASGYTSPRADAARSAPSRAEASGYPNSRADAARSAPSRAEASGYTDSRADAARSPLSRAEASGYTDSRAEASGYASSRGESGDAAAGRAAHSHAAEASGYVTPVGRRAAESGYMEPVQRGGHAAEASGYVPSVGRRAAESGYMEPVRASRHTAEPTAESGHGTEDGGGRRRRAEGQPTWQETAALQQNGARNGSHARPEPEPESPSGSHAAGRSVNELLASHGGGTTTPRRRRRRED